MAFKFLFRLDDIAPNMNWTNYEKLKEVFVYYGIKPLLGVIPDNQDLELKGHPGIDPVIFWEEIRDRQKAGWEVAVHGYQHLYATNESGIIGLQARSEFAGLSYNQQLDKLKKATQIFRENKVEYITFMAPSHSFDSNTIRALRRVGICSVTDGFGLSAYRRNKMLFVPQLFAKPKKLPLGTYTFCLHLNTMTAEDIVQVERFLEENVADATTFSGVIQEERFNPMASINHLLLKTTFKGIRKAREFRTGHLAAVQKKQQKIRSRVN
ncbi:DUF2334 domain-containing protein [Planococcus lenghuensis]|uniref:DUF2334 domain-containing protein n=1 Tax=Planococcus lenghuensis TaxID=2213202 RepID=A0A1Q2L181_9BACL|nr:DUF2334 domain-containing protein [Planococcus lenghuensis]AQQ54225.1 hypothetical protein B0X71_14715 [Planococcus lenghuensis]